jgi:hypothetical protein
MQGVWQAEWGDEAGFAAWVDDPLRSAPPAPALGVFHRR